MNTQETKNFSEITEEMYELSELVKDNSGIAPELYGKYDVKRGLRDIDGSGVVAGLTSISEVTARCVKDGNVVPCAGRLYYRGISVNDITSACLKEGRHGFEETVYLLLFGELPNAAQLEKFNALLGSCRSLPPSFVRDVIMKAPSGDMMNALARSVLTLYSYDDNPDDTSIPNVLRQSLFLISVFPLLSVYGYQAYDHYHNGNSLFIHSPEPKFSTSENILHLLRPDSSFTKLESTVLDIALILHAEHGGGNNSTFTTRVVSSSGTDTYSAIAAALGSLKGPKHGGANIKVMRMFEDIREHVSDYGDDEELSAYLEKILNKDAFDRSGLIYGVGHAVYSESDPRALILRSFVEKLAAEKKREDEFKLYAAVERLAPKIIAERRKMYKGVSVNVDFYSGFAYDMLGLPAELYTPIFAVARVAGWSAHRLEELVSAGKIIRPAYREVAPLRKYIPLSER
ncbi:MAG: citrate/2-methylcitrate synthase [Clostridiales bacterium]|nr:citrate/2-methylcitrate synthase [Clostridiales bacterium]